MIQNEIWKDIPEWEGYYQASTIGRVRSVTRYVRTSRGVRISQGHTLTPTISCGYYYVQLSKKNKTRRCRVNRLIALTFIPNPHGYPYVNHKDENKLNNQVSNLEWCDECYNYHFGNAIKKSSKGRMKQIIVSDDNGHVVYEFQSQKEASEKLGLKPSIISRYCNGKRKDPNKYIWRYKKTEAD